LEHSINHVVDAAFLLPVFLSITTALNIPQPFIIIIFIFSVNNDYCTHRLTGQLAVTGQLADKPTRGQ